MKVEDTPANADRCICPGCPTFNECMGERNQRIFCSRGTSDCGPRAAACICDECPVWNEFSLGSYYFCMRGAAE